jgi:hypothetical protein
MSLPQATTLPAPAARRLQPPEWMQAAWMHAAAARRLLDTLGPQPALFVGGCVRDALLGQAPADIDIATPLLPDDVLRRLRQAGIKAIPTGIAHGTVTALLPPAQFEITTLRRDVATDGRHAEVAFGTDWQVDAERRDFTINALYADAEGQLYDPVGGLAISIRAACASSGRLLRGWRKTISACCASSASMPASQAARRMRRRWRPVAQRRRPARWPGFRPSGCAMNW